MNRPMYLHQRAAESLVSPVSFGSGDTPRSSTLGIILQQIGPLRTTRRQLKHSRAKQAYCHIIV
jgi:hypothetical protein